MKIKFSDVFNEKNVVLLEKLLWAGVDISVALALINFFFPFKVAKSKKVIHKQEAPAADESTYHNYSNDIGLYSYGDAVQEITESSMASTDKKEAISAIKQNQPSAYYEAIVAIAGSTMASADKVSTIVDISKK